MSALDDRQIRALRNLALVIHDHALADTCEVALAAREDVNAEGMPLLGPDGQPMTRSQARQACAAAISALDSGLALATAVR